MEMMQTTRCSSPSLSKKEKTQSVKKSKKKIKSTRLIWTIIKLSVAGTLTSTAHRHLTAGLTY